MKQRLSYKNSQCSKSAMTSSFDVTLVDVNRNQENKETPSNNSNETFPPGSYKKNLILFHQPGSDVHLYFLIL